MYLCVCKAVSERTARRAVESGEVATMRDLCRQHGVGSCCGKCVPDARALIEQTLSAVPTTSDAVRWSNAAQPQRARQVA